MLTILVGDMTEPVDADAVRSASPVSWPPLDLFESWRSFLVRVDVPGVKAGDLDVTFAAGPEGERFHRLERPAGSFRRSVALPTAVTQEMVHASVEDGVLTVVVPKLAPTTRSGVPVHPVRLGVARVRQPG